MKEKTAALIYGRNDGYKEDERLVVHINSLLDTFDEVLYLDWNSPDAKGSLLENIKSKLNKTGKLKHFIIPENIVNEFTGKTPGVQPCLSVICYNILLRRTNADWIVTTTNDIIAPNKQIFNNFLSKADKNTFYTISRRDIEYDDLQSFGFNKWEEFRNHLDKTSSPRHWPAKVTPNDNYSLINCCGDFQLAHKDVWNKVKGFEEQMIYACFQDTNIQKKAVLNGFDLKAIYDIPLYHMSHKGMGNDGSSPSKQQYNDAWGWVENFQESLNDENWGWNGIDIEYEMI